MRIGGKDLKRASYPTPALPELIARRRHRLIGADDPQQEVLEREKYIKDLVTRKRQENEAGRDHGVEVVVVGGRHNRGQDEGRVADTQQQVEQLPKSRLAALALLQCASEEPRVVDQRAADAEGVAEVHAWHRGQCVHVLTAHPHALRVVVAHGVEEAEFGGEEPRRHAWV